MTLNLNKKSKYTSPYYTNWDYLRNMTDLQMKPREEMTWNEKYKEITGLWYVPDAFSRKIRSMRYFADALNDKIKGL